MWAHLLSTDVIQREASHKQTLVNSRSHIHIHMYIVDTTIPGTYIIQLHVNLPKLLLQCTVHVFLDVMQRKS